MSRVDSVLMGSFHEIRFAYGSVAIGLYSDMRRWAVRNLFKFAIQVYTEPESS